jgi:hypothetical protein
VIDSLTANIGQFKHCNSLVHFFVWGANVFTLDSNEHYFRSRNHALPQDSHSLWGSTRDLWTVAFAQLVWAEAKQHAWPGLECHWRGRKSMLGGGGRYSCFWSIFWRSMWLFWGCLSNGTRCICKCPCTWLPHNWTLLQSICCCFTCTLCELNYCVHQHAWWCDVAIFSSVLSAVVKLIDSSIAPAWIVSLFTVKFPPRHRTVNTSDIRMKETALYVWDL